MKPSQRGDVLWTAKGKSSVGSVSRLWDVSWNYLQNNREIQSLEKAVEMTNSPDTHLGIPNEVILPKIQDWIFFF